MHNNLSDWQWRIVCRVHLTNFASFTAYVRQVRLFSKVTAASRQN